MARYLVPGGTGNWNSTTNWSATSGGASGASFPVSTDDVIMDANSAGAAITVNVSSAAKSIDATNYTGTLTSNQLLTVSGSVTLGASMAIAGTNTLLVIVTGTLTSNGAIWSGNLTFGGANQTYTLADNWTVTGSVSQGAGASGTVNGNDLYIGGSLTTGAAIADGTTIYNLVGTGTLSGTGSLRHPLVINTSGTITIGATAYGGASIVYSAGTITGTGLLTMSPITSAITLDTGGMIWPGGVSLNLTSTITLLSDFNTNGLAHGGSTSTGTWNGAFNINCSGSFTAALNTNITGTATLVANGTGTWSTAGASAQVRLNTNINTAGTITLGSSWKYNTGTFTYIAGTVVTTGNTLTIGASTTLNTAGIVWENIVFTANSTMTINSLLAATGNVTITTVSVVFTGTAGWIFGSFVITTGNHTLESGLTYTITTNFTCTGTAANTGSLIASASPTKAILTLQQGATQDVGFCDGTRIDSSLGQTIWTYKGAMTNTFNWNALPTQPQTITTGYSS